MRPFGRSRRVENLIDLGTPDVAYTLRRLPVLPAVSGWLELKYISALPKRSNTPVRVGHLTLDQVNWIESEHAAGGRAWLLLQAGLVYMLLSALQVRRLYGGYPCNELLDDTWTPEDAAGFPTKRVLTCLTR